MSVGVRVGAISDDGKQIWDGAAWRLISEDRHWWWDGTAWQPVAELPSHSASLPGSSSRAVNGNDESLTEATGPGRSLDSEGASDSRAFEDSLSDEAVSGSEDEPDVEIQSPPDAGYRLSPTGLIVSPGGQWYWGGARWGDLVKKPSEPRPTVKGPKLAFGQGMQMVTTLAEVKKAISAKGSFQSVESDFDARNRARQTAFAAMQAACPLPLEPLIRPLPGGLQLFPDEFLVSVAKDWGLSSQRLTITTHRLIYTRGRATKAIETMYLQDVRDIKYIKPMLGFGKLGIENAAGVSSLEGLPAVSNAAKLRNDIMAMVHFARQRAQAPSVSQAPAAAAEDIPAKLKQLAELRDSGILTDSEFQSKKTELLKRL